MAEQESFKIEPLSKKTLNDAINLVVKVFDSKPSDFDYPGKWMPASLNKVIDKKLHVTADCTYVKYYVGLEENKVIGTTGIYAQKSDEKDSDWIAWYCVDPSSRGKGYGSRLLDFTINLAKKRGKKFLKLYTSYNPDMEKAIRLYKKRGFVDMKEGIPAYVRKTDICMVLSLR